MVAFGIYGIESMHALVRRECVDCLWRNRERFEAFCLDAGSFEEYVENMSRDNVWGGEIELQAMSLLYRCEHSMSLVVGSLCHGAPSFRLSSCRCNFVIYSARREPIHIDNGFANKVIELWFANNEHYDCVLSIRQMELLTLAQGFVCL